MNAANPDRQIVFQPETFNNPMNQHHLAAKITPPRRSRRLLPAGWLILLAALLSGPGALAQVATWQGNTDGNWSTVANWTGNVPTTNSVVFGLAGSTGYTSLTNDLPPATTVTNITFTAGGSGFTIWNTNSIWSTNSLVLAGNVLNAGTALQTINASLGLLGVRTFTTTAGGGNLALGGVLGGTGGLTKTGNGTLTLSGATNTFTGATTVNMGRLARLDIGGSSASTATVVVGNIANTNAVMTIGAGANVTNYNLALGNNATAPGEAFQSGGNLTLTEGASTGDFQIGTANSATTYGYYNLSGGALLANEVDIQGNASTGGGGVMDIFGGAFTDTGYITLARGSSSTTVFGYGLLNVSGAAAPATVSAARIDMAWNNNSYIYAVLDVGGGANAASVTCTGTSTTGITLFNQNYISATSIVNLLANGVLTVPQIKQNGEGNNPTAQLNFNGGTLTTTAGDTAGSTFFAAANPVSVQVYPGGGTVNNNGVNITIAQPIVAPTANGVTGVALGSQGSGYVGAPFVQFTGGTPVGSSGTPGGNNGRAGLVATAVANMVDDGTGNGTFMIQSIQITSPGCYTANPTGVTFHGGTNAASTAATIASISTAANTSGGMTFTGSGVTTLQGANNYAGGTLITGGSVVLSSTGGLTGGGPLTMSGVLLNLGGSTTSTASVVSITSGSVTNGTLTASTSYTVNNNGSVSVGATLAGTATFTMTNTGTLRLPAANTYSGATTIPSGTLLVDGSLGTNTVSVIGSGTTLGGTGTIGGSTTINGGASLAPGDSGTGNGSGAAGTITFSKNLTLAGETTLFDLTVPATGGNDQVVVGGNLTLDNSDTITVNPLIGVLDTGHDYTLFAVTGTLTMTTTPVLTGADPTKYYVTNTAHQVLLHYYGAPTPTVSPVAFSPASYVGAGLPVTISALVDGGTPPYVNYDWQVSVNAGVSFSDLPSGNGSPTYNLNTTGQAGTTNLYRLVVTDNNNATTAGPAGALIVVAGAAPTLVTNITITPPAVFLGSNATMTATFASPTAPVIYYQWQFTNNNGGSLVNITGATTNTYSLTNAQYFNTGAYTLMASNYFGVTYTTFSNLVVLVPMIMTDFGTTAPTPNPAGYDIAQLSNASDTGSPANLNYYSNNGNPPGQSFTTGGNPGGYAVSSVFIKFGVSGNSGESAGDLYTLRLYSMTNAFAGTDQLIAVYTNNNVAAAYAAAGGHWIQWYGNFTNVLAPNSVYAYSLACSSGYMGLDNCGNNPYAGGECLCLNNTSGGTPTYPTGTGLNYDGTFLLSIVPAGFPDIQTVSIAPTNSAASPVLAGTPVTLSVNAIGTNLTYVWQTDSGTGGVTWTPVSGSNTNIFGLATSSLAPGQYQYEAIVANSSASITSAPVVLNLVAAVISTVSISPASSAVNLDYADGFVTLSGTAAGNSLTDTWYTDNGSGGASWAALANSNTNSYVFNTTGMAANTYEYEWVVANGSGSVTSSVVNLYLANASGPIATSPTVITPPNQFVGGAVTASAGFTGTLPLSYQWQFNSGTGPVSIAGATNATYPISGVQFTNAGAYTLIASNSVGGSLTVTSSPASLVVFTPPATNTAAVILDASSSAPTPGSNDIAQFSWTSPTTVSNLNYFVNANPGQTFTTSNNPPTPAGFPLNSLYVLQEPGTIAGGLSGVAESYTLRIYQMFGTNSVLLTTYTSADTLAITSGGGTDGDWIQWTGLTNMLAPNSTYAFSINNNGAGYWKLGNDGSALAPDSEGDLYPGGLSVTMPTAGIGTATYSTDPQVDAAFMVVLTAPTVPVVLKDTTITPSSCFPGQFTTMSAYFSGANPIRLQWQWIDANNVTHLIAGATNNIYTITNVTYGNAGTYSLLASNLLTGGTFVSSTPEVLTVTAPPTTFVENFSYNINYSGVGPVPGATGSYWNEINASSQNLTSYADDGATQLGTEFNAKVLATFTSGATTIGLFQNYLLTQNAATNLPFSFSNLPAGVYNLTLYSCDGGYVHSDTIFTIGGVSYSADATTAASFIQGNNYVTFTNLLVTNGVLSGLYAEAASEGAFNGASLQMAYSFANPAITIITQPVSDSVLVGQPATFSVAAFGAPTLHYQWLTNGVPVPNATNSTYKANTSTPVTWTVTVNITNSTAPAVTSDGTAVLTVRIPDSLVWTGQADGTSWDLSTPNWLNAVTQVNGVAYETLDNVLFNDTSANNNITLNGVLTPSSVTVNTANTYTFGGSGSLSGFTGLTKTGSGTLVLSDANTYTGGTTLAGGQLSLGNAAALGTGSLSISNAAFDDVSGSDMTPAPSVAENWNGNVTYVGSANNFNTGAGGITLNANVQVTVGANTLTSPGIITDNGNNFSLAEAGGGTLALTNYNNYTGGTVVNSGTLVLGKGGATGTILNNLDINPGGIVELAAVDALGYSVGVCVTGVTIAGGTLDDATTGNEGYRTSFTLMGGIMSSSGGGDYNMDGGSGVVVTSLATNVVSTISGNIVLRSSGVVFSTALGTVPGGIDLSISGIISGGGNSIIKSGSGTLSLSGANTYTGNTTISGGTLLVSDPGQLGGGFYGGNLINSGTFSYASSAAQTLSGVISGAGAVQQNGPGLLTLSGANTYTGNTTVNAGTLEIVHASLNPDSTVAVAGGAVLQLDFTGVTNEVAGLVLGGVSQPAGVYNSSTPGGYITGGGSLLVVLGPTAPASITSSVNNGSLSLSWPAGQGWRLQMQTNSLSVGIQAKGWVYVTDGTINSTNIPVNTSIGTVFYRLTYP